MDVSRVFAAVLVVFVLVFTPVPIQLVSVEPALPEIGQATNCLGVPALVLGIALLWLVRSRRQRTIRETHSHHRQQR